MLNYPYLVQFCLKTDLTRNKFNKMYFTRYIHNIILMFLFYFENFCNLLLITTVCSCVWYIYLTNKIIN